MCRKIEAPGLEVADCTSVFLQEGAIYFFSCECDADAVQGWTSNRGAPTVSEYSFLRLVTPAPLLTHTVPPLLLRLFAAFVGVIFQCWLYTVDRLKSIKLYHTSTPQIRATHNIDSLGFYKSTPPLILEFKKHLLNYLLFKKNKIRLFAFINWRISSEHFPFLSYILSTQCFFCYEADLLCYVIFHNC